MKLYEITDEFLGLDDIEDELIDIEVELNKLEIAFSEKAENIAKLVRSLEAQKDALATEAKRLTEKRDATQNRIDSLKAYLKAEMERIGRDKIQAGIFRVRLQNSPLTIDIIEESKIPDEFKSVEEIIKIDKRGIIELLKSTGEVPAGVTPIQRQHIRIY